MQPLDWIGKHCQYRSEQLALRFTETGASWTYGQLNSQAEKLCAHFYEDLGLRKGDRIALIAQNSPLHVVLLSVAQKMGIVLVPFNYRLAQAEWQYLIGQSQPRLILVDESFWEKTLALELGQGMLLSLNDLREQFEKPQRSITFPNLDPEDPLFILFTSGTTGFPKGAIYTHRMLFWNSLNTLLRLGLTDDDCTLVCMPLFHTGGWNVLLTPLLHCGGSILLASRFEALKVLREMEAGSITLFMGVPTMLEMMRREPIFKKSDFPNLRFLIAGGEAAPIPLIEAWAEKGIAIRQGYGLTEVGPNLTSLHQDDAFRKKGSIGKPNFYVQIRLVREDGSEAAVGERGELWLKGPVVTPGYWQNAKATEESLEEGWFKTGDVLLRDEEGYLFVVDRIKNMYISGGENVYPAEIERILLLHKAIAAAAVIGIPHEKWGETGLAFIVVAADQQLTEAEILEHCQKKLAKFKVPQAVRFLKELPQNDTGKIDRKALWASWKAEQAD